MAVKHDALIADVATYYGRKLAEFGDTPQGVDWNGLSSQQLRFEQLCRVITPGQSYSIADFGCGYGALFEHLEQRGETFEYLGVDASVAMIESARMRLKEKPNAIFEVGGSFDRSFDYTIASGIFNVRVGREDKEWSEYIEDTLDMLVSKSIRGVAFNCLTSYSDSDKKRPDLYYADPLYLFDHCKRLHSRNVALLHDYGLYEFTILIRKGS